MDIFMGWTSLPPLASREKAVVEVSGTGGSAGDSFPCDSTAAVSPMDRIQRKSLRCFAFSPK